MARTQRRALRGAAHIIDAYAYIHTYHRTSPPIKLISFRLRFLAGGGAIVQASLSLDNTVETVLLRNEGDFIGVEQATDRCTSPTANGTASAARKQKQREENMRQLLDVTNTYTTEELRDFEMR